MATTVRSFAKINLGLCIGPRRADGFHEPRTLYHTLDLHDIVTVRPGRGNGIQIRANAAGGPTDDSNTCYRIVEAALTEFGLRIAVHIEIEKRLPMRGGLGGASSNAIATLLALERELKRELPMPQKLRLAAEVGSDLPLFLLGGTVLGVGRGEEVYPAPDLPSIACVIAMPDIGVSTPEAFAAWDRLATEGKLTARTPSDRINLFSSAVILSLNGVLSRLLGSRPAGRSNSGVPAVSGGRAETPLLDLVRTGIANDFEQVVFPQHPELRDVKRVLEREGAKFASLSGSGSAVYGLFQSRVAAERAARKLSASGIVARATTTLPRREYWKKIFGRA